MKEQDYVTKKLHPVEFIDWKGNPKVIKSGELKKFVFSHGYEAGVVLENDLIPYPIQSDPTKYQRDECAKITDESVQKFTDKIIDLAISREPAMAKMEVLMPYYQRQTPTVHLNLVRGECPFFHLEVKYWTLGIFNSPGFKSEFLFQDISLSLFYIKSSWSDRVIKLDQTKKILFLFLNELK